MLVTGVAHRLHSKHGKNMVLLGDGCQALRVGSYAHGIVFSAKELKTDELFEVSEGGIGTKSAIYIYICICYVYMLNPGC